MSKRRVFLSSFFFYLWFYFFSPPSSVHHAHSSPADICVYCGLSSVRGSLIFKKEVRMRNGKKRGIKHTLTISWTRSKTNCAVACASPLVHMHACPCIRLLSGVAKLIYVRAELRNWSAGIQIPPPPLAPNQTPDITNQILTFGTGIFGCWCTPGVWLMKAPLWHTLRLLLRRYQGELVGWWNISGGNAAGRDIDQVYLQLWCRSDRSGSRGGGRFRSTFVYMT